jgi:hypothetical protein
LVTVYNELKTSIYSCVIPSEAVVMLSVTLVILSVAKDLMKRRILMSIYMKILHYVQNGIAGFFRLRLQNDKVGFFGMTDKNALLSNRY